MYKTKQTLITILLPKFSNRAMRKKESFSCVYLLHPVSNYIFFSYFTRHCSKLKKKELLDLSLIAVPPCHILTKSPQISGQNKSKACKPEELVKMTNSFLRMEIFAMAGNSN